MQDDELPRDAAAENEAIRRGILRIARGVAETTGVLPGEFELARQLGSSRATVRRVLAGLELAGVVNRHQGAATTVDPAALRMTVRMEEQLDHSELLARLGYEPTVEIIASQTLPAPLDVARVLMIEPASPVLHGIKKWRADGVVAMIGEGHTALPHEYEDDQDPQASVFARAESIWQEPVVWEITTPGVAVLDEYWARQFELPTGSACLTLQIVGVSRSGRRVFSAFERHHPDLVTYSLVRTLQPPWGPVGAA